MKKFFKLSIILALVFNMVNFSGCGSSDTGDSGGDASCKANCLKQGGLEDVCEDGCNSDEACSNNIETDCFELCIESGYNAFDCSKNCFCIGAA